MTAPFAARVGGILSADIAVPDHELAVRFYARVLGTGQAALWRDDLTNNLGMPIIGLGKRSEEYARLPLQWMPHVQVADVAASAKRAVELGGTELMHARDGEQHSQWAVLLDPQGAAFGIIPVVPTESIPATDGSGQGEAPPPPGRIAWADLTVADPVPIREFYRQVVGWAVQDVPMEDAGETYADYSMLGGDGQPAAGVCHARGVNAGLPPVWLIYLPVGDLDESIRRVHDEGGAVITAQRGADGEYAYAVVRDPVGAYVALAAG
jgi:uncharacterized protein